jgi:hypothetical protein
MGGAVSTDAFGSRIGELGAATGLSKISGRRLRVYERFLPPQPVMATLDEAAKKTRQQVCPDRIITSGNRTLA